MIGWSIRKFNAVLLIFAWGMIFHAIFENNDWIAMLVTAFLLGFQLRR